MSESVEVTNEPGVVTWYRLYCVVLLILTLVVVPLSVWEKTSQRIVGALGSGGPFPVTGNERIDLFYRQVNQDFDRQRDQQVQETGVITAFFCLILGGLLVAALVMRPTPQAWSYHLVVLCLGLCGCLLPISVLLLIQWFQPATQRYFGRTPES